MTRTKGFAAGAAVLLLAAGAGAAQARGGDAMGDRPSYAKPGECYEKVRIAEVFETVPERQLATPERVEHRLIPAEFAWRDRTVVVHPARVEHYTVPPTYRTVMETEVVRPPSYRTEVVPAVYEAVTRQVLVREARTLWKRGVAQPGYGRPVYMPQPDYGRPAYAQQPGYGQQPYAPEGYGPGWSGQTQVTPTGEVLCLVYEPAVYRTVTEQVLREPERTVQISVPGETRQVSRQVVDRPAYETTHEIPADLSTVREQVEVRPARDEAYTIPATYRTVESRRLVSPARFEWRRSQCVAPAPAPPPPMPPPPRPPMIAEPLPCHVSCAPAPRMAPPPPPRAMAPPPARHRPMGERRVHRRYDAERTQGCGDLCASAPPEPRPMAVERAPEPRPMAAAGRRQPMTARLQAALGGRGYYRGPTDGVFTEPTRDALVRFQRDKGFAADGQLTRETARELGLGR